MKKSKKCLPLILALAFLLSTTGMTSWTVAAKDNGNGAQVETADEQSSAKIRLSLGMGRRPPNIRPDRVWTSWSLR